MLKLPEQLKTKEDLSNAYNYFYSDKIQKTDLKYLRFGQFLFNCYNIEFENSYNEKDPSKVLYLINEVLNHIASYNFINDLLHKDRIKLPKKLKEIDYEI